MQAAVLGLCGDSARDVFRKRLLRTCSNNRRSGLAGGVLEACNFKCVEQTLRCFGKRVRVWDVQCIADFWEGRWLSVSSMGSACKQVIGTLVWSREDRHVYVAHWGSMSSWASSGGSGGVVGRAPWFACNFGSPKKKRGFRGGDAAAAGRRSGESRAAALHARDGGAPLSSSGYMEAVVEPEPIASARVQGSGEGVPVSSVCAAGSASHVVAAVASGVESSDGEHSFRTVTPPSSDGRERKCDDSCGNRSCAGRIVPNGVVAGRRR